MLTLSGIVEVKFLGTNARHHRIKNAELSGRQTSDHDATRAWETWSWVVRTAHHQKFELEAGRATWPWDAAAGRYAAGDGAGWVSDF